MTFSQRCRKYRRLTEDGFTTPGADVAIRKLQAQQEDTQASLQLERDITANPDVQAAASIIELFVTNVDDTATGEFALRQFQNYFADAQHSGNPGHGDILRLQLHGYPPAQAVLSFQKLRPFRDGSGKVRRRGCAIVEVPTIAVADFFCAASQHTSRRPLGGLRHTSPASGINCAPTGRHMRCVNIKRNARRGADPGTSDATRQNLDGLAHVSIVDIDFREAGQSPTRERTGRWAPEYCGRRLWKTSVDSVRNRPPWCRSCAASVRVGLAGALHRPFVSVALLLD